MCLDKPAEDTCLKIYHGPKGDTSGTVSEETPTSATLQTSSHDPSVTATEKSNDLLPQPPGERPDDQDIFPEGGARAWSVVAGSFCALTAVFGLINTTAVFQEYLSTHQLSDYSAAQIGWIFSINLFLTFFCGLQVGPIFDANGPRFLVLGGSILLFLSMMLLGECTAYWHFMLTYGIIGGLGSALLNTPALASVGHFFLVKRGNAMGIVCTSGSIGGVAFPLALQKLLPMVGFAWSTRILGFVILVLLVVASLLIRSRLPYTKAGSAMPDFRILEDLGLTFCSFGIFFLEWGLFVPIAYIASYAVDHGRTAGFSFQIVAFLNAGSFFGRWAPGFVADRIGRFNTVIMTITLCVVSIFALWLPAGDSEVMIIIFAVFFGFVSGSNLSLSPVCVGQLCETEKYGRYYGTCYTIASFGTLTGVPIAGQVLAASHGSYMGLIIFAGLSYSVALICFILSRAYRVGFKIHVVW